MNNEIKEILEFKENADYKRLSVDEIIVIKDYIIDLQEKYKQTKLLKELYKLRNEKAIEYIKAVGVRPKEIDSFVLLNILQGSDKDEK